MGTKIPSSGKRESPYVMLHSHHQNDSVTKTSSSMKFIQAKLHVVHRLWHLKKKVAQTGLNPGLSADHLITARPQSLMSNAGSQVQALSSVMHL